MAREDRPQRDRAHTDTRLSVENAEVPIICPASKAIELVAHKWTIQILFALHQAAGPIRFRKLQVAVKPITQKELTKRLRNLERAGMVDRQIFAEVPPRVEYRLTELGSSLIPALTGLHDWAEQYGDVVDRNQRSVLPNSEERRQGSRAR
jgi:DNA-binding HxlR family transcriptional regulator